MVLGLVYFFNSTVLLRINAFIRSTLFDDRIILLKRKKLAILFFCLSFIFLNIGFAAFSSHIAQSEDSWKQASVHFLMYQALQNYADQKYDKAMQKYQTILTIDPKDVESMKRISYIYEMQGKSQESRKLLKKALRHAPHDKEILRILTKHDN